MVQNEKTLSLGEISSLLMVGTPVEVQLPAFDIYSSPVYTSEIVNRNSEILYLKYPESKGERLDIESERPILVRFSHGDAPYACTCRTLGVYEPLDALMVSYPYRAEPFQRRDFVRIDAVLPVTLTLQEKNQPAVVISAFTANISGGGMLVKLDRELPLYSEVKVVITFPKDHEREREELLFLNAQVYRRIHSSFGFRTSFRFQNTSAASQQQLIRFIFDFQRKIIQSRKHLEDI
jgi:c-di-GMP-binding flagellar brake protein YcgR